MNLQRLADSGRGPAEPCWQAMRHHPPPPRLAAPAGLALLALAMALFGVFAADLLWHGPITQADAPLSRWFHDHAHPVLTTLLLAVTRLHSTLGVSLMAAVGAAFLAWRRQTQWLPALVLGVPGGVVLNMLVKEAFQRARPVFVDPLLTLTTYSFPSGHAAGATLWWGFALVFILAHRPPLRWQLAGALVAAAMISLTALSRVYLGVHYPSDVLAAVAEGTAWLVLCFTALGLLRPRGASSPRTAEHG